MNKQTQNMLANLNRLLVAHAKDPTQCGADAYALRRISVTLHRWHELECGDGNDRASWTVTRGKMTRHVRGMGVVDHVFAHDESGAPFLETHYHDRTKPTYSAITDRERGAQKRLAAIMARYPGLTAYVQGDPRGCALYILQASDIPDGATIDSCYSRGVAVFK